MSTPDSPTSTSDSLSSGKPTEEELGILNTELLDQYAQAYNAINLLELINGGYILDWAINDDGKMAPCIRDKSGAIYEHPILKRQYAGSSGMVTFILPFMNIRAYALTPGAIARSAQRLNDEEGMPLVLKPDCRQELGIEPIKSMGDSPDTSVIYDHLAEFTTTRAAKALIEAKGGDFEQFTGSPSTLAELIQDKHYSKIYAWPPPPKMVEGQDGISREVRTVTCRASLFQNRKQDDKNMDPEEKHLPADHRSAAPTEFHGLCDDDKQLVRAALSKSNGARRFTPITITLPNGKLGSSAMIRNDACAAAVIQIGNINFSGRGGAVFVRKCTNLIVYKNGPPAREANTAPLLNAMDFVQAKMKRARDNNDSATIKGDADADEPPQDDRPPKLVRLSSKLEDVKRKLARKSRNK